LKILLVSSTYEPFVVGGAERVAQALATSLGRAGHRVVVVTTQPQGEARDREVDGVAVHYVPVRNLYRPFSQHHPAVVTKALWRLVDSYNLAMLPVLTRILQHEAPDIVNTHNMLGFSVAAWSAAQRLNLPIVHTMHDQYLLCHRSTMFKAGRNCSVQCQSCRMMALPRKHASRHVDVAVGVSQFIVDRHARFGYFPSAQPMVIYNTGLINASPAVFSRVPSSRMRFGFLGQIIPTKGLHSLIDAFVAEELMDAELWIAGRGEGSYEQDLRRRTQAVHNIHWLGHVRPTELFENIDVLVVPSVWHDTAPLVLLEAASHSIPVLGSNRGGIPELIATLGGWMFEPDDPASLRAALIRCKRTPAQVLEAGRAAMQYAKQLKASDWCQRYLEAFTLAIERRQARVA
jgi:glycosyltransferase involved in cell wall biosynthesis